jgi:hypothetical protein
MELLESAFINDLSFWGVAWNCISLIQTGTRGIVESYEYLRGRGATRSWLFELKAIARRKIPRSCGRKIIWKSDDEEADHRASELSQTTARSSQRAAHPTLLSRRALCGKTETLTGDLSACVESFWTITSSARRTARKITGISFSCQTSGCL